MPIQDTRSPVRPSSRLPSVPCFASSPLTALPLDIATPIITVPFKKCLRLKAFMVSVRFHHHCLLFCQCAVLFARRTDVGMKDWVAGGVNAVNFRKRDLGI